MLLSIGRKGLTRETQTFVKVGFSECPHEGYSHTCLACVLASSPSPVTTKNKYSSAPGDSHTISTSCPWNALQHPPVQVYENQGGHPQDADASCSGPCSRREVTDFRYTPQMQHVSSGTLRAIWSTNPVAVIHHCHGLLSQPTAPCAFISLLIHLQWPHRHHP